MNCETYRDRVFDVLAGRPVDRPTFDGHRSSCASCAGLLEGISENERILSGARVPAAPADLWPRIAAALARPVPARRPRGLVFAAAAAALLAAGVVFFSAARAPRPSLDVAIVDASPDSGRAFTALVPRYEDVDAGLALADTLFRFGD